MTDTKNNPWRDKYRRALAQQEQLEKTLTAQQAILHRAVTTLADAAEGGDNSMDERLQAIRASVKNNDVAGFDRMLKSLPRVAEEAEERQQKQWQEVVKVLSNIATQIQQQGPSADVKPGVKQFKKQLPKGVQLIPATLKRLLQELSDLQQQAINASPKNSTSLLGRLFKDKGSEQKPENNPEENNTETASQLQPTAEDAEWEEVKEPADSIEGDIVEETPAIKTYDRERSLPEALLAASQQELSSDVPDKVSVLLVELLDHFKTVPSSEQKATKARQRLEQGIKWFELAPTLEDIRDFVLQAYIGADNEYRDYLERLDGELSELLSALGVSITTEQRFRQAADNLHTTVSDGMLSINQALSDHTNIDQLKTTVESHIQQLQLALTDYKQQDENLSESESLALQLKALASKVQQMEQNEADIRTRLAEEKQRSITDSLTGLPNREAYGEKLYEETQRWQCYGHPLSLAVVDIDFFKKVNDNYGHQTGDKVLKIVANAVSKRLREVDFMARFGGEEFVLLLPETSAENALGMLNRIREAIATAPFRYQKEKITITVSIGIAEFNEGDNSEAVFAKADQALYDAKEGGRNQCRVG